MRIAVLALIAALGGANAQAQTPPQPATQEGDLVVHDFRFASGETLPELKIHYTTLGVPKRDSAGHVTNAVMMLHGTSGSGRGFLRPQWSDILFGPGQPLDLAQYYVILPDGIGHGKSSKPSDGLHARFPHYNYDDMVEAQRRLLVDELKIDHLRLLMGTSMGCMHAFVWGEKHPGFAQALLPLACQPMQIAGMNRAWRKAAMDLIRTDPAWQNGDYAQQPMQGLRGAWDLLVVIASAPLRLQKEAPTRELSDAYLESQMKALPTLDANDLLYQLDASRDYDPSKDLERITVPVTWVNSGDDLINPPDPDRCKAAAARMKNGKYVLIPLSADTYGHATHSRPAIWKNDLVELLKRSELKS
ncbi:MAG: metA [Rhodospirillales bacterium]|nr:metA [Rhodospirillales bacterium]